MLHLSLFLLVFSVQSCSRVRVVFGAVQDVTADFLFPMNFFGESVLRAVGSVL